MARIGANRRGKRVLILKLRSLWTSVALRHEGMVRVRELRVVGGCFMALTRTFRLNRERVLGRFGTLKRGGS